MKQIKKSDLYFKVDRWTAPLHVVDRKLRENPDNVFSLCQGLHVNEFVFDFSCTDFFELVQFAGLTARGAAEIIGRPYPTVRGWLKGNEMRPCPATITELFEIVKTLSNPLAYTEKFDNGLNPLIKTVETLKKEGEIEQAKAMERKKKFLADIYNRCNVELPVSLI